MQTVSVQRTFCGGRLADSYFGFVLVVWVGEEDVHILYCELEGSSGKQVSSGRFL
jgi:hypothetical protein